MSTAANKIRENAPDAKILEMKVDLADVKTVSSALEKIKEQELLIDVLVLNAGLAYFEPTENLYNFNSTQVVNHYSHFYLLGQLLPNLKVKKDQHFYKILRTPLPRKFLKKRPIVGPRFWFLILT